MTATILQFPRPAPRLVERPTLPDLLKRRDDPSLTYQEREQVAVAIDMQRAAGHFLTLPQDGLRRKFSLIAGSEALEGALFHSLCLKGAVNQDSELIQLLARRQSERTQQ